MNVSVVKKIQCVLCFCCFLLSIENHVNKTKPYSSCQHFDLDFALLIYTLESRQWRHLGKYQLYIIIYIYIYIYIYMLIKEYPSIRFLKREYEKLFYEEMCSWNFTKDVADFRFFFLFFFFFFFWGGGGGCCFFRTRRREDGGVGS